MNQDGRRSRGLCPGRPSDLCPSRARVEVSAGGVEGLRSHRSVDVVQGSVRSRLGPDRPREGPVVLRELEVDPLCRPSSLG